MHCGWWTEIGTEATAEALRGFLSLDVKELEVLILSVMKHELGMIVNLGALIGFILGLVNLILL